MNDQMVIDIGSQYSHYPVGRYRHEGESNGEKFREEVLRPALLVARKVIIELDGALGYGSSFLDEVFGGMIRLGFPKSELMARVKLQSDDESLIEEIHTYISEAEPNR